MVANAHFIRKGFETQVEIVEELLALPINPVNNDAVISLLASKNTVDAIISMDDLLPLDAETFESRQEPESFSEQLEQFVAAEIPEAEQEPVLQRISAVRDMVEAVMDQVSLVDSPEMTSEELSAIPISEELVLAVTELLHMLGMPEPSEQLVRRCVVRFRVEIVQARAEQPMTNRINDILHERYHIPHIRDAANLVVSTNFHRLLGWLVIPRPTKRAATF